MEKKKGRREEIDRKAQVSKASSETAANKRETLLAAYLSWVGLVPIRAEKPAM